MSVIRYSNLTCLTRLVQGYKKKTLSGKKKKLLSHQFPLHHGLVLTNIDNPLSFLSCWNTSLYTLTALAQHGRQSSTDPTVVAGCPEILHPPPIRRSVAIPITTTPRTGKDTAMSPALVLTPRTGQVGFNTEPCSGHYRPPGQKHEDRFSYSHLEVIHGESNEV